MFVKVRSSVPGRIRWEVPALLNCPVLAQSIVRAFQTYPGVTSVEANSITGRVLLHYQSSLSVSALQAYLQNILAEVSVTPGSGTAVSRAPIIGTGAVPTSQTQLQLLQLITRTPEHRRLAQRTIAVAFLNRLFEAAPPAMISTGMDIITRGPKSILGRLGFKTISSQLLALSAASVIMWTADALIGYRYSVMSADLANEVECDLRNELYQHLQCLDVSLIEEQPVSKWMTLIQDDIGKIGGFIENGVDPIVTMVTNGLIVGMTFVTLSPTLAALHLLTLPGLYFLSTKLLKPIRERQSVARRDAARLNAILSGNIAGMATITSFAQQDSEKRRVEEASKRLLASTRQRYYLSASYVPWIQMVVGTGFLPTLLWGVHLVNRGKIIPSNYNLMGSSSLRLLAALGRLGISLEQYQRTKVSLDRVNQFLSQKAVIRSGTRRFLATDVEGDIEFSNVNFGYEPDRPILRSLSLRFPAGQTTGIVGSTGAGKTTVLKLLLRFYDVDSGSIRLDSHDLRDLDLDDLHQSMALVPQQIFLFAGTIRDNIAYAKPEASLDEVMRAARIAEAHQFIEALAEGYDTYIGERGAKLSGGQQQRLAIARAVLANRPILLFDEATSALDYETEAALQRSLQDVTAGRTTIIVAHRLSTIRHADLIYVLDDGQVREQGSHDELVKMDGIYASLWKVQTGESHFPGKAHSRSISKTRVGKTGPSNSSPPTSPEPSSAQSSKKSQRRGSSGQGTRRQQSP
jgi:ATP-binding cassette subfamily B protein